MSLTIRIIRPAGRAEPGTIESAISNLETAGHRVLFDDIPVSQDWPFVASTTESRVGALQTALLEEESDVVICARGGYGASDLLPLLSWEALNHADPKILVGFSDISALHSALFTKCRWRGIHGPMPATSYWNSSSQSDVQLLWDILENKASSGSFSVKPVNETTIQTQVQESISGWLFGGCFSVLTHLIGTDYFPSSLSGSILFLEDVGEPPGRLMRHWNQWLQCGVLDGVKGVVLGSFSSLNGVGAKDDQVVTRQLQLEFAKRSGLPTWQTESFGHISPNVPIVIGATAEIVNGKLKYHFS